MKFQLAFLVCTVFLMAACGTNEPTEGSQIPSGNVPSDDSVGVDFIENAPPAEVYSKSQFEVILRLQNLGQYTIPEGELEATLGGFYPPDFNINSDHIPAQLKATNDEDDEGLVSTRNVSGADY